MTLGQDCPYVAVGGIHLFTLKERSGSGCFRIRAIVNLFLSCSKAVWPTSLQLSFLGFRELKRCGGSYHAVISDKEPVSCTPQKVLQVPWSFCHSSYLVLVHFHHLVADNISQEWDCGVVELTFFCFHIQVMLQEVNSPYMGQVLFSGLGVYEYVIIINNDWKITGMLIRPHGNTWYS